jgi:nitrite reductase/ring-hydroxylating ferredoxin subunit/uncharacterized membrane protein
MSAGVKGRGRIVAQTALDTLVDKPVLDTVADPLSTAIHRAYETAGDAGRTVKNAMHGVWLGHPLHPVLTDIPLGAWTTALVFDAAEGATGDRSCGRAADIAVSVGLAGAIGAAVTGLTDWSETDGRSKRVGLMHGLMNLTATSLYATSLAMRRRNQRDSGRAFGLAGFIVACSAAYLGGRLVYSERIGVAHSDEGGPETFTPVLTSSELRENGKQLVKAGDTPVVLARQHGQVCALAEHCSHLGGPLSEGTLKDGSIVCPWHGSEFSLNDGRVINGPATHPQPCFEARESDGVIDIRART